MLETIEVGTLVDPLSLGLSLLEDSPTSTRWSAMPTAPVLAIDDEDEDDEDGDEDYWDDDVDGER